MVKSLILTGFGINCEEEIAAAYRLAGAEATIAHLNEVLHGLVSIHDFDILNFPGGFSFGDDLASGKVMANKIRYKRLPNGKTLLDEIRIFLQNKGFVMGVCNGFQMLTRLGLLPDLGFSFTQQTSLHYNQSGKYEDRWCHCKVNPNSKTPFLKDLDVIPLPVRHGEGRLIFANDDIRQQVQAQALNCLTYCTADGTPSSEYPINPNGAELNCAGLCDSTGQVFGLMPHPEAFLSLYNHPNWGNIKRHNADVPEEGLGLKIFKNIVEHVSSVTLHV